MILHLPPLWVSQCFPDFVQTHLECLGGAPCNPSPGSLFCSHPFCHFFFTALMNRPQRPVISAVFTYLLLYLKLLLVYTMIMSVFLLTSVTHQVWIPLICGATLLQSTVYHWTSLLVDQTATCFAKVCENVCFCCRFTDHSWGPEEVPTKLREWARLNFLIMHWYKWCDKFEWCHKCEKQVVVSLRNSWVVN